jgi:uncharacterized protein involved in exopolysaccharide biosynthesis/Mrp family chromosome partitioning ATPase
VEIRVMRNRSAAAIEVAPQGDADFRGVLATLLAKKWLILFLTLLAGVAAVVFVNVVTPKYTGEARIILEYRDNYFTRPDKDQKGFEQPLDAEAVQSQVQAIMSRDLARTVIRKLNLGALEEFDPMKKGPGMLSQILSLLGIGKDRLAATPEERVLEAYFDKLLVYNVGKSRVIAVEFSSRDGGLAANVANAVADEYITMMAEAKKATTKGASAWLANAIEPMRQKVAEAEARTEAYRAQNGLLVGSGASTTSATTTIIAQQLSELSTQMSAAKASQSELLAKARIIREALRQGRVFETSEVTNNELIRRLLEQRVAMKTQLALEERTLLPGHPRMKELNAQLADLESQIRAAAERTARTLENDAKVAGARVQEVQRQLDSQKGTAATANEAEVQLRALEREAKALRDNYEQYLVKYRDAVARDADAAAPADARVISRAITPRQPSFPKKLPIILLATLATLVLTSAIIMTRALFSTDGYEPPEMLPAPYGPAVGAHAAPALAAAPVVAAAALPDEAPPVESRPAPPAPTPAPVSPATATALDPVVNDLRTLKAPGRGLVAGVHGFGDDVLAQTTAIPLARLLAAEGSTVLVDFAAATEIDSLLTIDHPFGISDLLAGAATFGEAIHRDRRTRLHVIPLGLTRFGADEPNPDSATFRGIVDALRQSYEYVVLCCGPLGEAMDAMIPAEDSVLMITSRDDSDPDVARAIDEMEALKPNAVTVIVEDPMLTTPRPANDRVGSANSAA